MHLCILTFALCHGKTSAVTTDVRSDNIVAEQVCRSRHEALSVAPLRGRHLCRAQHDVLAVWQNSGDFSRGWLVMCRGRVVLVRGTFSPRTQKATFYPYAMRLSFSSGCETL
jgi:hypothetical protein